MCAQLTKRMNVSKIGSEVVVVIARLDCAVQWHQETFVLGLPYRYSGKGRD